MASSDDVYAAELEHLRHGLPLWDPEPTTHGEVQIGDVGFIYRGAFHRLFNAMSDPNDDKNLGLTLPDPFRKLSLPRGDLLQYDPCAIKAGALCSRTVTARSIGVNFQASSTATGQFEVECTKDRGAMLILKDDAERHEVIPTRRMAEYMKSNYRYWVRLAKDHYELELDLGQIYFVRGFVKSTEWVVSAFHGGTTSFTGQINLSQGPAGIGLSASWSDTTHRTPDMRDGPRKLPQTPPGLRLLTDGTAAELPPALYRRARSQCVFLHYYKMQERRLMPPKVIKAAAEREHPQSGRDESWDDESRFSNATADDEEDLDRVITENYAPGKIRDPVDDVLAYILNNSDAEIAIASDRDAKILHEIHGPSRDIVHVLQACSPGVLVDSDGFGMLEVASLAPDRPTLSLMAFAIDHTVRMTIEAVPSLRPALSMLTTAWEFYAFVKYSKAMCRSLLMRAQSVLHDISKAMQENRCDSNVENIQKLQSHFVFVRNVTINQANMSFLKSLLRLDDTNAKLEKGHHMLNDCLVDFQIRSQDSVKKLTERYEDAKQEDARDLKQNSVQLVQNEKELLAHLELKAGDVPEAMQAIQRGLTRSEIPGEQRALIETSLVALHHSSHYEPPKDTPTWAITYYDIDFDPSIELGGGGFGIVTKAQWQGVEVAIKRMKTTNTKTLIREVETWVRLRHDHIVPCYGASISADPPFIVLHFMQNGNLMQYLQAHTQANRIQLLHEVSLGLQYLHSERIVHGDIKGVNILVDDVGKACITDFGLAFKVEAARNDDRPKRAAGTLRYMAPELMRTGRLTYATDVYAFGMLIYETFTQRPPFLLETDQDVHSGRLVLERPGLQEIRDRGLTDEMWELHQLCASKDSGKRPIVEDIATKTTVMAREWELVKTSSLTGVLTSATNARGIGTTESDYSFSAADFELLERSAAEASFSPTCADCSLNSGANYTSPDNPTNASLHSSSLMSGTTAVETTFDSLLPQQTLEPDIPIMEQPTLESHSYVADAASPPPRTLMRAASVPDFSNHPPMLERQANSVHPAPAVVKRTTPADQSPFRIQISSIRKKATILFDDRRMPVVQFHEYERPVYPELATYRTSEEFSLSASVTYQSRHDEEIWKLEGQSITRKGPSVNVFWRFEDEEVAHDWFVALSAYAKRKEKKSVFAGFGRAPKRMQPTTVEWRSTETQWRRVIEGKLMWAPYDSSGVVPDEPRWNYVPLPDFGRVVVPSSTSADTFSFTEHLKDRGSLFWTVKLLPEMLMMRREARRDKDSDIAYVEEHRCFELAPLRCWFEIYRWVMESAPKKSLHSHVAPPA